MRPSDFVQHLLAFSLLVGCFFALMLMQGCAAERVRMKGPETVCIPDPANGLFHCNGVSYSWKGLPESRYVCTPIDQWERLLNDCRAN